MANNIIWEYDSVYKIDSSGRNWQHPDDTDIRHYGSFISSADITDIQYTVVEGLPSNDPWAIFVEDTGPGEFEIIASCNRLGPARTVKVKARSEAYNEERVFEIYQPSTSMEIVSPYNAKTEIGPYGGDVTVYLEAWSDHWIKPSEFTISLNGKNIPFTYREPGYYVDENGDDDPTSPYLLVTFNVPPNDIYETRNLSFKFNPIPYMVGTTLTVIQEPKLDPDGSMIPICEPITYTQNSDKMEYNIFTDGSMIYSGNAYRYPDSNGDTVVEVNDILSDHLQNHISFTEGLHEMDGFYKLFEIGCNGVSGYKMVEAYNAWEKPKWPIINEPISTEIDPRQYLFINYIDGYGEMSLYQNGEEFEGFGAMGGFVYVVPRSDAVCGEDVSYEVRRNYSDVVAVQNYTYKETNKNYALYYINAYGGWDSLAIRGNVTQTDKLQSQTYKNKTNGKVKYLNAITPSWQLHTDSMNDGSKMYHLLESTEVYLHNLETDEIIPVVITDSECVYKTYANQGNTRFHYTINVEASNYKIRK